MHDDPALRGRGATARLSDWLHRDLQAREMPRVCAQKKRTEPCS